MKKKQILFICSNMNIGGFQKSLISLLQHFNYDKYDVDLLLLSHKGIFIDLIPKRVNLIKLDFPEEYFDTFPQGIKELLRKKQFRLASYRGIQVLISRIDRGYGGIMLSQKIPAIDKKYDVAIDYNGQHILYYMIEKLKANKKITFFHSDYNKWNYYKSADKKYFKKVDSIVTVSEICKNSIEENFKEIRNKINVIENIVTEKTVNMFPLNSNSFDDIEFKGIRVVTVGRLCYNKGADIAIEAQKILISKGYNIRWYWIGPCEDNQYKDIIEKNGLKNTFLIQGETINPYDYMRNADIIVLPSRFEGKSVAIEEAKILSKPIVATNFSTVDNQLQNRINGIITEMSGQALSEAIEELIVNKNLTNTIKENLSKNNTGNEHEIEKLYKLIEGN